MLESVVSSVKDYVSEVLSPFVERYFEIKSFERSGRIYELLGVKQFNRLYSATVGREIGSERVHSQDNSNSKEDFLLDTYVFTRLAEGIHVPLIGVTGLINWVNWSNDNYGEAVTSTIANVFVNVYPVLLQRYNRSRVNRILDRESRR